MGLTWLCAAVVLAHVAGTHAFYERGSEVISLRSMKDVDAIAKSKFLWIVELYREGCGYCQQLTPEYEKTAKQLEKLVRVAAVDVEKHRDVAGALQQTYGFQVKGVPTIVVLQPKTGSTKKERIDYNGERTATAMTSFLRPLMPDYTTRVTKASFEKFVSSPLAKVILFSDKPKATSLLKALSAKYHERLTFGIAGSNDKHLTGLFSASEFPSLYVLPKDVIAPGEAVKYTGQTTFLSLDVFLMDYAAPKPGKDAKDSKAPKDDKAGTGKEGKSKEGKGKESAPPSPPAAKKPATEEPKIVLRDVDVAKLSVKQLKAVLRRWNDSCTGCSEKADYVARVAELRSEYGDLDDAAPRTEL
eukprot:m.30035 g.30035  ORF g.30035 m.30035 type:complete len:358 (+) comp4736_c0_seq1:25-1098(+)